MAYDIETLAWAVGIAAAGAALFLLYRACRRWIHHGENIDVLPPELSRVGAVKAQAFSRQRALLGSDLLRDAKKVPDHEREIVNHALWHAMLLAAASDGSIDPRETRFVADFFGRLTGRRLAVDGAEEAAGMVAAQPAKTLDEIAKAGATSLESRQHILEGAFLVSLADGELIESEGDRLGDIADVLGFDLVERQAIYREMANRLEDRGPGS